MTGRAPSVDAGTFRRLLGSFASGVTVLTTVDAEGAPAGMTASAVAAVSLDPPLLLVCVAKDADCHRAMQGAASFALHVLRGDQADLSQRFAASGGDKFDGVEFDRGPDGIPLLRDTLARIACARHDTMDAGDHTIFLGRVTGGDTADGGPLLHFRGAYHAIP